MCDQSQWWYLLKKMYYIFLFVLFVSMYFKGTNFPIVLFFTLYVQFAKYHWPIKVLVVFNICCWTGYLYLLSTSQSIQNKIILCMLFFSNLIFLYVVVVFCYVLVFVVYYIIGLFANQIISIRKFTACQILSNLKV